MACWASSLFSEIHGKNIVTTSISHFLENNETPQFIQLVVKLLHTVNPERVLFA
jgi:hypothetical protein